MTLAARLVLGIVLFAVPALFAIYVVNLWVDFLQSSREFGGPPNPDWSLITSALLLLYAILAGTWFTRTAKPWSWVLLPFIAAQALMAFLFLLFLSAVLV